jgi:hypothetical protein
MVDVDAGGIHTLFPIVTNIKHDDQVAIVVGDRDHASTKKQVLVGLCRAYHFTGLALTGLFIENIATVTVAIIAGGRSRAIDAGSRVGNCPVTLIVHAVVNIFAHPVNVLIALGTLA